MTTQKYIMVCAVAILLLAAGVFFILTDRGEDQQPQIEAQSDEACAADADCVLVQDGWCKTILAVNKDKETEWKEENAEQTEAARQNRQTCELMPEEYFVIENFQPVCRQSECVAEFFER